MRFLFLLALCASLTGACRVAAFSDVSIYHPHRDAITYVQEQGIVSGYPDGTFLSDRPINRAEFTKIVLRASSGVPQVIALHDCFPDVPSHAWFHAYVCPAKSKKIIGGYPDGTFRPDHLVNVAEAVKIVATAFSIPPEGEEDVWFLPYYTTLASRHILPASIQTFDQYLTRGEMAEMIFRLKNPGRIDVSEEPSYDLDPRLTGSRFGYRSPGDHHHWHWGEDVDWMRVEPVAPQITPIDASSLSIESIDGPHITPAIRDVFSPLLSDAREDAIDGVLPHTHAKDSHGRWHLYLWTETDERVQTAQRNGGNLSLHVILHSLWGSAQEDLTVLFDAEEERALPLMQDAFLDAEFFLQHLSERYDGDGVDDMPGLIRPVLLYGERTPKDDDQSVAMKRTVAHGIHAGYQDALILSDPFLDLSAMHDQTDDDALSRLVDHADFYDALVLELDGRESLDALLQNVDFMHHLKSIHGMTQPLVAVLTFFEAQEGSPLAWDIVTVASALFASGVDAVVWVREVEEHTQPFDDDAAAYAFESLQTMLQGMSAVRMLSTGTVQFTFPSREPVHILWSDEDRTVDLSEWYAHTLVTVVPIVDALDPENVPIPQEVLTVPASSVPVGRRPVFVRG